MGTGAEDQRPRCSDWSLCLICTLVRYLDTDSHACPGGGARAVVDSGTGQSQKCLWVLGAACVLLVALRGSQAGT